MADLPDYSKLKGIEAAGLSVVLDGKGEPFAELFEPQPATHLGFARDIPDHVQKAFVAAEDKRFYQHKGVDERGMIRAFIGNLGAVRAGRRAARPSPSRW